MLPPCLPQIYELSLQLIRIGTIRCTYTYTQPLGVVSHTAHRAHALFFCVCVNVYSFIIPCCLF